MIGLLIGGIIGWALLDVFGPIIDLFLHAKECKTESNSIKKPILKPFLIHMVKFIGNLSLIVFCIVSWMLCASFFIK